MFKVAKPFGSAGQKISEKTRIFLFSLMYKWKRINISKELNKNINLL